MYNMKSKNVLKTPNIWNTYHLFDRFIELHMLDVLETHGWGYSVSQFLIISTQRHRKLSKDPKSINIPWEIPIISNYTILYHIIPAFWLVKRLNLVWFPWNPPLFLGEIWWTPRHPFGWDRSVLALLRKRRPPGWQRPGPGARWWQPLGNLPVPQKMLSKSGHQLFVLNQYELQ